MNKNIRYSSENGGGQCVDCKSSTFLLSMNDFWSIDQEPIQNGQTINEIKDKELRKEAENIYENGIELGTEVTCHYCPKCKKITSININW